MTGEIMLVLVGAGLLYEAWRRHVAMAASMRDDRKTVPLEKYPSLTVIRPVKGLDVEARENVSAALDLAYPGEMETIFVFDSRDEPAFPVVQEEVRKRAESFRLGQVKVIFCGEPPPGRTGKLNAMIQAFEDAKGEVIVFADSDIRPPRTALSTLVETLYADPNAGSAFGQVIVGSPPRTVGDVGYALLVNSLYAPAVYYQAKSSGYRFPFIMGQVMALRREAIEAIGGLESASGQLVDDMYLGRLLDQKGWQNLLAPLPLPIVHYGLGLKAFWKLFVRWLSFGRSGLPGMAFKLIPWLRGAVFWTGLILGAAAWLKGWRGAAILNLAAPLSIAASMNILQHAAGGARLPWTQAWVSFVLVVASPLIYASILFGRKVNWRGRTYVLDVKSRLAAAGAGVEAAVVSFTDRRRTWVVWPPELERRRAA